MSRAGGPAPTRSALERARLDAAAARGWVAVRFTWRQVVGEPHARAARVAEVLALRAAQAAA